MNSNRRRNSENDSAIRSCSGKPRECVVHSFVLTVTTLIFVISMALIVYLTYKSSMNNIVVVLIVASCLLYILGFISNVYHIYYSKSNSVTTGSARISHGLNQATGISVQNSFSSGRPLNTLGFCPDRQPLRNTPPPPYEIQMSEMSRMLLPGTSRPTDVSIRETEITEEARKLIRKMYEEIRRADQQVAQSPRKEQSVQQIVQTPTRQHGKMLPKVSRTNLVNLQETAVKSVAARGFMPSDFRTNPATQQKTLQNSPPAQLDLQRLVIGSEGCTAAQLQPSPRREDFLQVARKRKLSSLSKELQTRPKTIGETSPVVVDNNIQNDTYEPIEVVRRIPNTNSSEAAHDSVEYYCIESEFDDSFERASSVCSTASEPGTANRKRKFRNPNVKVRRQLSAATTRKFRQLGQSPETVLDAIATCFDLTPDEWMVAWKLGHKGVSPIERARLLGVRLHENSSNNDN